MFEDKTYENILNDMLSRVSNDVDKREGSIIYDALAPIAYKLAETYFQLNNYVDLFFADTAVGEFLERRTAESGVERRPATKAIRKIVTTRPVDVGTRWGLEDTTYVIIEKISDTEYRAECEQYGTIGNLYSGALDNIDNISDVSAELTDVLILGEDEETDEELYQRYLEEINAIRYGGNVDQYREWISAIPGVGRFKIQPLWNGRGTVRAIITDANNQVPSQELIDLVQNTLDPYQDGMGTGLVPIGHVFTAMGAIPKVVNVTMTVVFEEGYGPADIQQDAERIITEYFSEINFEDQKFVPTTVRHAVLLSRLINIPMVRDILVLTLNGIDGNITLAPDEVASLGTVTINAD
ncbi:MAG TPA: baseplate J protein [Hungateiclostridium thermocellum]|uniref:Baseplate J family protein n=1 Tax=Acetivibrio thermocellus (strain ATCC 27405 / DSM 1237 / JCM 9322 / NBRC 103400 / NCIMB 10682 / NRRL B-4536 / VPI 7372) TaxID=203119 RepID=A3DIB5_ACET2|nr:baseplate J/gp47 family protein [Acetivibrio thermocellus]ABN53694.1 Baseplate J family protein [Acetivibrio thermocellus ATCC 27405]HBW25715.1 baseplate J protein [Acetivibrio thermocellus]